MLAIESNMLIRNMVVVSCMVRRGAALNSVEDVARLGCHESLSRTTKPRSSRPGHRRGSLLMSRFVK